MRRRGIIVAILIAIVGLGLLTYLYRRQALSIADEIARQQKSEVAAKSGSIAVDISGFAFDPKVIKIKSGSVVIWTNRDSVEHTVTSEKGEAAELGSESLGQGDSYKHTFRDPGTYSYYCIPHSQMKAAVIVVD